MQPPSAPYCRRKGKAMTDTPKIELNVASLEKAAEIFYATTGIEISFPWQGSLDDLEQSRSDGFIAAFRAYLQAEMDAGRARRAIGWESSEDVWSAHSDGNPKTMGPNDFHVLILRLDGG